MPPLVIRTTGIEDYLDETGQAFIKALIMGEASAGKTRSASFWPKPFFADCEQGRMAIADRKVPYVEIATSDQMFALTDMLKRECMKPYDKRAYQTLVIDTLDAFQRKVIAERLAAERKEALSGWADWGYLDAKMTMLVERLLNLPMNIVVNLHIKERGGNDDDGPTRKEPKLKGDIRDQIANEFDLVGHMSTYWVAEQGERKLKRGIKWAPEPTFPILKDRSGQLPPFTPVVFGPEDYTGLLDAFRAGVDKLEASEEVGQIEMDSAAVPVPSNLVGGPVEPKTEELPRTAAKRAPAKKAAPPPAATPKPTIGGADPAPEPSSEAAGGEVPATTDVATREAAVSSVEQTLGGTVIADSGDAEVTTLPVKVEESAGPAAEDVLACGTPGKTRSGELNDAPAPGCGANIREIATTEADRDKVNICFLTTRTYLCPACFAAFKAAKSA